MDLDGNEMFKTEDRIYLDAIDDVLKFSNSDDIVLTEPNNSLRFNTNKYPSFDPIDMANSVYGTNGFEVNFKGQEKFYRPKPVKFYDFGTGKYFIKTVYIPETFDGYYQPNPHHQRSMLLSKLDLLKLELKDKRAGEDDGIIEMINTIYTELQSTSLAFDSSEELSAINTYFKQITETVDRAIKDVSNIESVLAYISKRIKSENFIGALSPTLEILGGNDLIINTAINNDDYIYGENPGFFNDILSYFNNKDNCQDLKINIVSKLGRQYSDNFNCNAHNDIFTLLPILFNPKAVDYILNEKTLTGDRKYKILISLLNKASPYLMNIGGKVGSTENNYESLKSTANGYKSNHIYIRDGISRLIYSSSIKNMLLSHHSSREINWVQDNNSFICDLLKKFLYMDESTGKLHINTKELIKKYNLEYLSSDIDKLKESLLKTLTSKLESDHNGIFKDLKASLFSDFKLYNGSNPILKNINLIILEEDFDIKLTKAQIHYLSLLDHASISYNTAEWSTEFYSVILKAMGIEGYSLYHTSSSNSFDCQVYEIFKTWV